MTKQSPIVRSAIILGGAMLLAKITGFAREIVLAAFFGAGTVSDAFILAFTIPEMLLLLVSTSVAASFIPMFYRVDKKNNFTRNIITCLIIIGLLFSVIFYVFPGALVRVFAFQIEQETFEIAAFFTRYMVWAAVFMLVSDVYSARLEINGAFFASGLRGVWRNTAVIVGLVAGALSGMNIFIALAPVVGTAFALLVLGIACKKQGFVYRPHLDLKSPQLRQMLVLVMPIFLATAASQLNAIVSRNFAASLPAGAISYLNYSLKVAILSTSLLGTVFSMVMYPHMSKLAAEGDMEKLKSTLSRSIVYITAIMLPLCVGVFVLAHPTIRILFQRGEFTAENTMHTAAALRMYSFLLIFGSVTPLLLRAFHAIQNTRIPAIASFASVIMGITLNFLLINPLGTEGLALSGSLAAFVLTVILFVFLRKKIGGIELNLPEFAKILIASAIMGVGVWFAADALPLMYVPVWQSALLCAVLVAVSAIVYFILLLLMKSKTARGALARKPRDG